MATNTEENKTKLQKILVNLPPEHFKLLITTIASNIDTEKKCREVADLIFEKAINEPNFVKFYIKLYIQVLKKIQYVYEHQQYVKLVLDKRFKGLHITTFRNVILDNAEREFNTNVINEAPKKKLFQILENLNKCNPNEKLELQEQLIKEAEKINKRSCGIALFVGELFNSSLLSYNIITKCIKNLLNETSENKLECLCLILKTVGKKYESTPTDKQFKGSINKFFSLQPVFKDLQLILYTKCYILSSKVRSLLEDLISLQKNNWQTLNKN